MASDSPLSDNISLGCLLRNGRNDCLVKSVSFGGKVLVLADQLGEVITPCREAGGEFVYRNGGCTLRSTLEDEIRIEEQRETRPKAEAEAEAKPAATATHAETAPEAGKEAPHLAEEHQSVSRSTPA